MATTRTTTRTRRTPERLRTALSGSAGRCDPAMGETAASGLPCGPPSGSRRGEERGGRRTARKEEAVAPARPQQDASSARPRRLHVRYERAGRRPYSAVEAGGSKMTAAQIAEARRMAGVKAEVTLQSVSVGGCDSAPCSARRMAFEIIHRVAGDYPEVGLSSSSVGR